MEKDSDLYFTEDELIQALEINKEDAVQLCSGLNRHLKIKGLLNLCSSRDLKSVTSLTKEYAKEKSSFDFEGYFFEDLFYLDGYYKFNQKIDFVSGLCNDEPERRTSVYYFLLTPTNESTTKGKSKHNELFYAGNVESFLEKVDTFDYQIADDETLQEFSATLVDYYDLGEPFSEESLKDEIFGDKISQSDLKNIVEDEIMRINNNQKILKFYYLKSELESKLNFLGLTPNWNNSNIQNKAKNKALNKQTFINHGAFIYALAKNNNTVLKSDGSINRSALCDLVLKEFDDTNFNKDKTSLDRCLKSVLKEIEDYSGITAEKVKNSLS